MPYFSRRIGLVDGREVPILAGGKVNGRVGDTNFGGLVVGTDDEAGVVEDEAVMAVGRVKQNSGANRGSAPSPPSAIRSGRSGSWLGGADFTYATSRFRGDKNFLVGVWGLATDRDDLGHDSTAYGFKIDYPERSLGHCADATSGSGATSIRRSASSRGRPCICTTAA